MGNNQKYSIYAGVKFSAIQFRRTMTTLFPGKHWTNFLHWETLTAQSFILYSAFKTGFKFSLEISTLLQDILP